NKVAFFIKMFTIVVCYFPVWMRRKNRDAFCFLIPSVHASEHNFYHLPNNLCIFLSINKQAAWITAFQSPVLKKKTQSLAQGY
ncbi:hypothetical protein, partial [Bartonella quintana]|uniref:hypothetical protein n=1 Tax=Bartonella quintana TaxID=803 RepID=UPI001ABB032A